MFYYLYFQLAKVFSYPAQGFVFLVNLIYFPEKNWLTFGDVKSITDFDQLAYRFIFPRVILYNVFLFLLIFGGLGLGS